MKKNLSAVELILSDNRGIYIPRDFITGGYGGIAEEHCIAWGLTEENRGHWIDAEFPENKHYWDAWNWILDNAKYTEESTGNVFTLYQDGALWGICYDIMTAEEKDNFGLMIK